MDLTAVTEIAEYMEREIGIEISPRQPFVGRHFNVTRAGIHADGLLKDEEIYNIFDTAKILNRPALVAVDATSGTAGVAHWLRLWCARLTRSGMSTCCSIRATEKKGAGRVMSDSIFCAFLYSHFSYVSCVWRAMSSRMSCFT